MGVIDERTRNRALTGGYRLLEDHGRDDDVTRIRASMRHASTTPPTIVAIGEVKRGKSTLLNALLGGSGGLLPVGVDITTGAFIRIVPPEPGQPTESATIFLSDGRQVQVPTSELADWVTVGGARRRDGDSFVVRAEVVRNSGHIPGMALVDTPGVGGLDGGHAQLAMRAARQASALLFVADAGQPLTAPELRFLGDAAAGIDVVVFAVTKTDKHPAGWRDIVSANRELLRQHAPRFTDAPMVGVAAPLALDATEVGDPALAAALVEESGVLELAGVLNAVGAQARELPMRNALRRVHTSLLEVRMQVALQAAAAGQDAAVEAGAIAERERLIKLRDQKARWTLDLERDLGRLRSAALERLQDELQELRKRWTERISDERLPFLQNVGEELAAALSSDLLATVERVIDGYGQQLGQLVVGMFESSSTAADLLAAVDIDRGGIAATDAPVTTRGVMDPSVVTTGLFGASWAGRMFGAETVATGVFAALGGWPAIALGGAWLVLNAGFRLVRTNRQRLLAWVNDVVVQARSEVTNRFDTAVRELKPDLVIAYKNFLEARIAELNVIVKEADNAARQSETKRRERIAGLERHVEAIDTQMRAIEEAVR